MIFNAVFTYVSRWNEFEPLSLFAPCPTTDHGWAPYVGGCLQHYDLADTLGDI